VEAAPVAGHAEEEVEAAAEAEAAANLPFVEAADDDDEVYLNFLINFYFIDVFEKIFTYILIFLIHMRNFRLFFDLIEENFDFFNPIWENFNFLSLIREIFNFGGDHQPPPPSLRPCLKKLINFTFFPRMADGPIILY
jgi:hypothetical protein